MCVFVEWGYDGRDNKIDKILFGMVHNELMMLKKDEKKAAEEKIEDDEVDEDEVADGKSLLVN